MKPSYSSLLEKIFSAYPMYHKIGSAAYKEGLENIETLAEITGHPEKRFRSIHVAGTNGKGSVVHLLASFFQEKGYKTGVYTSPHLVDFKERVKINGKEIQEEKILDFFQKYQPDFDSISPSFFEMTTMLAFDYFANEKVDIAIVETGLGGRLDATNIITPELSVITNISLDHTRFLGNTLPLIASEKAGIIKHGVPVVIGEYHSDSFPVFKRVAEHEQSPIFLARDHFTIAVENADHTSQDIKVYQDGVLYLEHVKLPLTGQYQLKNVATFFQAIEALFPGEQSNKHHAKRGIERVLENTHFQGRWQVVDQSPLTICDVAHNAEGLRWVARQLEELAPRHLHVVFGMADDKDLDTILSFLPKQATTYYICEAAVDRALKIAVLYEKMQQQKFNVIAGHSVFDTYKQAREAALPGDAIFVGGSCFVVGDFLKSFYSSCKD